MSTEVLANILSPIHNELPPSVWDDPSADEPKLKVQHRKWIQRLVHQTLTDAGYSHIDEWLSLVLTGSLTTYQYGPESDCDVSVWVDSEHLPEWSRAEMIGLMISKVDGTILPGTSYPMQCFVVARGMAKEALYQPGLRSGYDLTADAWITPPERDRVHDVKAEQYGIYAYALEQADKMETLLKYEPDKAVEMWHMIHQKRMRDQRNGHGDYALSNVIYKFLANRGLFQGISEASGEYIAKVAEIAVSPIAQQAYEATVGSGGITIGLHGEQPTTGYAFAPAKNTELVVPQNSFTPEAVDQYIGQHTGQLSQPDNYLGIWADNGDIYLDITQVLQDYQQAFDRASAADQLAMYDLTNGSEVPVLRAAKTLRATPRNAILGAVLTQQVAKFVYDPIANRLFVGQMGNEEGENVTHYQLMKGAAIDPKDEPLFGQVHANGYAETFGRPQLTGYGKGNGKPSMNPYEAEWRMERALKLALPGVKFTNPSNVSNPRWEEHWTDPSIQYFGERPTLDATDEPAPAEDQWVFSHA